MKNLKNKVINLKDQKIEIKAAKDKQRGTQEEGKIKNASMSGNNRNDSTENETDISEIRSESINDGLGAEIKDKTLNSFFGLESQLKAIQIKANCDENQSKQNQIRKDIRKEAEIKVSGLEKKSDWTFVCSTYKRKDLEADSKAFHKHVIASKRDAQKHQRIISLLIAIQIKQSDYMRQYVWN